MTPDDFRKYHRLFEQPLLISVNVDEIPAGRIALVIPEFYDAESGRGALYVKPLDGTLIFVSSLVFLAPGIERVARHLPEQRVADVSFPLRTLCINAEEYHQAFNHFGLAIASEIFSITNNIVFSMAMGSIEALPIDEFDAWVYRFDLDLGEQRRAINDTDARRIKRAVAAGRLIVEIDSVPEGNPGAYEFEEWCIRALSVLYSQGLRPIYSKPNSGSVERRDIVATNTAKTPFWRRVLEDLGSRLICFEVKNFSNVRINEYRQVYSYVSEAPYGEIGFILNRKTGMVLSAEDAIEFRKMYHKENRKMILELRQGFVESLLADIAFLCASGTVDDRMGHLLDTYYLNHVDEPHPRRR